MVLRAAAVVAVLVVLAAAVWAWIHVPGLYPVPAPSGDRAVDATREATRSQAVVTTRASVLAALAGLGALVTIAINYRNSRTAAATLSTTNETFRITARGHLTDRYTKAIEQLGATGDPGPGGVDGSVAIRLGGIYALQQFAVETDRDTDQATVVEVLSAFVRTRLPRLADHPPEDSSPPNPPGDQAAPPSAPSTEPAPDILAAISALAQLPARPGVELRADFSGIDFSGTRLSSARLRGAVLSGAFLRGAVLSGADLRGAVLSGADLRGADLRDAVLSGADLHGADLRRADLSRADIQLADLHSADLQFVDLRRTALYSADLRFADLRGAVLSGADLHDANLRRANLRHAVLRGAVLNGAVLNGAFLDGAVLDGATLSPGQLSSDQLAATREGPAHPDVPMSTP